MSLMRANLDGFTVRPAVPFRSATPFLVSAAIGVILAHLVLSVSQGMLTLGALLTAVVAAACCTTWVIVRIKRYAARLVSALVGLPAPAGGWTRPEQRTIDVITGRRELPMAVAAPGEFSDVMAFVVLLVFLYIPTLGLPEIESALAAVAVLTLPAVSGSAIAALAFAWRADGYLHSHLVPLTERVAETQLAVLAEAA